MKVNREYVVSIWNNPSWRPMKAVLLFIALIIIFHYLYLYWISIDFSPFRAQIDQLFDWSSLLVFRQSVWVLERIFGIDIQTTDQTIWLVSNNGKPAYVGVSPGCTSLKQWMHWIFLMLLFPGPWKHKLWYIPVGIIVLHFVNVFRIFGLALTLIPWPGQFDFFHDYAFRPFFYFMILVMWIIWVEFFYNAWRDKAKP